jgi:hypothetical protein
LAFSIWSEDSSGVRTSNLLFWCCCYFSAKAFASIVLIASILSLAGKNHKSKIAKHIEGNFIVVVFKIEYAKLGNFSIF